MLVHYLSLQSFPCEILLCLLCVFTENLPYNGINFALTHCTVTLNPRRLLLKILIPWSFYKCYANLWRERGFGVFSVLHARCCAIKDKFLEWPNNTILIYVSYIARKLIMHIIIFIFTLSEAWCEWNFRRFLQHFRNKNSS